MSSKEDITHSKGLVDAMKERHTVKNFVEDYKLDSRKIREIVDAARLAPTSFGLDTHRVFIVENQEMKKKLMEFSHPGNIQVRDSSTLLIFATKNGYTKEELDKKAEEMMKVNSHMENIKGYTEFIFNSVYNMSQKNREYFVLWMEHQTYISFGVAVAAAAQLHVDSAPIEGFEHTKYDELLGIDKMGYHSIVLLALGKEKDNVVAKQKHKVRPPMEVFATYIN